MLQHTAALHVFLVLALVLAPVLVLRLSLQFSRFLLELFSRATRATKSKPNRTEKHECVQSR